MDPDLPCEWAIIRRKDARACPMTLCSELCKKGWTDRFAVRVVDTGGPKEAQVQSYLPGGTDVPVVKYSYTVPWPVQKQLNRVRCHLGYGLGWDPRKHTYIGPRSPMWRGQLLGERTRPGVPDDILLWAVQMWLNRSICHLFSGLGWAKGGTSSIIFARWCQCTLIEGHIGATWRIRLNCPSATAKRPDIKLF